MTYAATTLDVRVTGRRIVATFVDALVFAFFSWVLERVFGLEGADGFDLTTLSNTGTLWLSLVVLLYYVLLEGLTGRTLGKLVSGIRVVDAGSGGRPGLLSGLVRTLLRMIDGLLGYLVGLIIVVNSANRRRLGDMAAKTLVVRAR
ncbi:RDD family protein [Actinoplanes sp. URMC 104]|uniref:RDD family protein n=1 Tax=Actinoplanes sp. URMC 104 TaxID=3423409 RepID=UPI003F1CC3AE